MPCEIEEHRHVLQLLVPNIRNLRVGTSIASHPESIGGLLWSISVTHGENGFLGVGLNCTAPESMAEFVARAIFNMNVITERHTHGHAHQSIFSRIESKEECEQFMQWDNIVMNTGVVARDGSILIEFEFFFELHVLPHFLEKTDFFDYPIVVGDRTFYVDRYFLANISNYFKDVLFREENKSSFELSDLSPDFFLFVLHFADCPAVGLRDDQVESLLRFARRIDSPFLLGQCELYLSLPQSKTNKFSLADRFLLAEKYDIPLLRQHCIQQIHNSSDLLKLQDEVESNKSLDETSTATLTKLFLEEGKRRIRDPNDPSKSIIDSEEYCVIM